MAKEVKLRVPADRLTKKKVAIVGFTDHRVQAYDLPRDEWEVWGINELHRTPEYAPEKFDRWFEVHPRKDIDTDAAHIEALGKMDIPVYMQAAYPDIPPSIAFPRAEVEALSVKFFGRVYFTSSIAWEMALAIHMGAREVHIYGVDMAQDQEYARERPCLEAWLGVAGGLGIKTYVPPTSDLLKTVGQYGFGDDGTEFSLKVLERIDWLHRQDNDFLTQIRRMQAEYPQYRQKIGEEYEAKIQELVAERDGKLSALDNDYQQKMNHLMAQRNQVVGAISDCEFWKRSWSIIASKDRTFSPDRSQDPRTGIKPKQPEEVGINPERAIAEPVAA